MELHSWITSLHSNETQLLVAAITGITTIVAAIIAVQTAFRQIIKQFENKVMYEAWADFQSKLFNFSTALSNYDCAIMLLTSFVKNQNNRLINGGNIVKYRFDKWKEVVGMHAELQNAYIAFLCSYETHEIIFNSLEKMHYTFIKEYRKRVDNKQEKVMKKVFSEMYGENSADEQEQLIVINNYWTSISEISAFLDDFRRELQNETIGKILKKKTTRRAPQNKKYEILTTKGFKTQ